MLDRLSKVEIGPLLTTAIVLAVIGIAMMPPATSRPASDGHRFVPTTVELPASDEPPVATF